ncbi:MAG TPA: PfkB family carbohydrate kinase [Chlamydiales bacterium]|nr:PfkB family carbohydrate kinase [Chlamydiales bacterium]
MMTKLLSLVTQNKIHSLDKIQEILEKERRKGMRIIHCHGVFDLLHPGHIRHFKTAKAQGDRLVVSVTPDRFVNKGPGRPVFTELLRLESIAALQDVDYVVLNDSPDAISAIKRIHPTLYVKGIEYADHAADVTGKISEEARAVEECGGSIFYTDDIVFSSSSLLNRYFDSITPQMAEFIKLLKSKYSVDGIIQKIDALSKLKVLIVGDAIIDEYQYTEPLGQSGKGIHMAARCMDKEVFLGGSLIIANHVSQYAGNVTLLTAIGKECPYGSFITTTLDPKVKKEFVYLEETSTLIKKRYLLKDGKTLSKLFETYSGQEKGLNAKQSSQVVQFLKEKAKDYDLVLVSDFGNGFSNSQITDALSDVPSFLAVNTQTNSGNRGFNVITHYRRADYISLNEPEIRLAAQDRTSSLEGIAVDISEIMNCPAIAMTKGVHGVACYSRDENYFHIPAFATNSIDRIGAGDSFLSLSSLCMAGGESLLLSGFVGSIAAALSVQMIGNQEPIKKAALCKFIIRLLK